MGLAELVMLINIDVVAIVGTSVVRNISTVVANELGLWLTDWVLVVAELVVALIWKSIADVITTVTVMMPVVIRVPVMIVAEPVVDVVTECIVLLVTLVAKL